MNFAATLVFILLPVSGHCGERLEEAAREAALQCHKAGANTIEQCSNLVGSAAEFSIARKAATLLYNDRNTFVRECETSTDLLQCQAKAEWSIIFGFASAKLRD